MSTFTHCGERCGWHVKIGRGWLGTGRFGYITDFSATTAPPRPGRGVTLLPPGADDRLEQPPEDHTTVAAMRRRRRRSGRRRAAAAQLRPPDAPDAPHARRF